MSVKRSEGDYRRKVLKLDTEVSSLKAENAILRARLKKHEEEYSLTLAEFRKTNVARCNSGFTSLESESPLFYSTALAGEVGEVCNLVKKMHRDKVDHTQAIADELADAYTYLDLLAARLGIDLDVAVPKKFNEVSDRRGVTIKLFIPSSQ